MDDVALSDSIFAIMKLKYQNAMTCMTVVSDQECEQIEYWRMFSVTGVSDRLHNFRVLNITSFQHADKIGDFTVSRCRCMCQQLDVVRSYACLDSLAQEKEISWMVRDVAPDFMLRLPIQFCLLIARKQWNSLILLDFPESPAKMSHKELHQNSCEFIGSSLA